MVCALALDLGLSRTRAAIYDETTPRLVPLYGNSSIPSTVTYDDGELLVGERTEEGKDSESSASTVRLLDVLRRDSVAFGDETKPTIDVVTAFFEYVFDGVRESGIDFEQVVVAGRYFTLAEQRQLVAAAQSAGSSYCRFLRESEAVAMYHGEKADTEADRMLLTLTLGSSSARAGVIHAGGGVYEVLSHAAESDLGGREWDRKLSRSLDAPDGRNPTTDGLDERAVRRGRESLDERTSVSVPVRSNETAAGTVELTREAVASTLDPTFDGIKRLVERALDEAGYEPSSIDHVLVSGRLARSPFLRTILRQFLDDSAESTVVAASADACALGAAVQAGILDGAVDDVVVLDIAPDISVVTAEEPKTILPAGTSKPMVESGLVTMTADGQTAVPIEICSDSFGYCRETRYSVLVDGLPEAPAGTVHLRIGIEIDENGFEEVTVGIVDRERRHYSSPTGDEPSVSFEKPPAEGLTVTGQNGLSVTPLGDRDRSGVSPLTEPTLASVSLGVVDAGDDGRQFVEVVEAGDPLPHRASVSVTPPRTTSGDAELPVFAAWLTGDDEVERSVFAKLDLSSLVTDGVRRRVTVEMCAADDGDVALTVETKRDESVSTTLSDVATVDTEKWR